jgi:hypothetical protein
VETAAARDALAAAVRRDDGRDAELCARRGRLRGQPTRRADMALLPNGISSLIRQSKLAHDGRP